MVCCSSLLFWDLAFQPTADIINLITFALMYVLVLSEHKSRIRYECICAKEINEIDFSVLEMQPKPNSEIMQDVGKRNAMQCCATNLLVHDHSQLLQL